MTNQHVISQNREIKVDGKEIQMVDHYIYLGQYMDMSTSKLKEVNRRIHFGWKAFGKASYILKSPDIALVLKRRVYNQLIIPTVSYGAETWSLTKKMYIKLISMQRAQERIMMGVTLK